MSYPTGKDFLMRLSINLEVPPACAADGRSARRENLLGTSLSYLYQLATCHPKCLGGDHVLQALVGRIFNHSLASAKLIEIYLYDESLNLTRSIAELTNLLFLFNVRPDMFAEWKIASRRDRMNHWGPGQIRERLKNNGWVDLPVSRDAYQELCELATHPTPGTRPNWHDKELDVLGFVGGVYEDIGHKKSVNTLLCYCALSSTVVCNMFGQEDRRNELVEIGKNTFYDEPYTKSGTSPVGE